MIKHRVICLFQPRWSDEPFYGYGIGFRSRAGRASSEQVASSSASYDLESSSARSTVAAFRARSERARSVSRERSVVRESSASRALSVARESSVSRAQSVARESSMSVARESVARAQSIAREQSLMARAQSVARAESVSRSLQRDESLLSSMDLRSQRARAIDIASRYASDDCLMRSNALDAAYGVSARALSASREILNTNSLTRRTLALDSQNVLHGRTLDERYYALYPKQHLVCPENCPLHNNPDWRRRFLIGNRFLDAAALGGFDVLYDPSVYKNSRRLLARLAESSEYDTEEISYERSAQSESSRRRMRATASMA